MSRNKQIISKLQVALVQEDRKSKVLAISQYAGDELEDIGEWIIIAMEEIYELNIRLLNIIEYYEQD